MNVKNIAYILDCFPVLSETFIVREILELQKKHFNVFLFARVNTSYDQVYSEVIHHDTRKLINEVQYLSSLEKNTKIGRWVHLIKLHLYFLLRNPSGYFKTFLFAMSKGKTIFLKFVFSVVYARALVINKIDHMHVHFALRACTLVMIISRFTGIPYSFTVHAHDIFIPGRADLLADKFNNAKYAVCISDYNRQYVLGKYPSINKDRIKIIHCGLDMSSYTPSITTLNESFNILAIGRLVEHKGFKYLIEACNILSKENLPDFTCNIIGEGQEREHLENVISAYGLEDVVNMHGSMEQADVVKALEKANMFVLPCVTEDDGMQDGIPVVLMEAMAMGIPVISTSVSGVPELVRDGAGILVEPKDVDGLSNAMKTVMSMSGQEKSLMGTRGRAIVEKDFNISHEAQKLAELISE